MKNEVVARRYARASLIGQGLFTLAWIVGGAAQPGYSHVRSDIATLAGRTVDHPWIGMGGMVALALSIAVLAPALALSLPSPRARVAAACFAAAGLMTLGWAVFRVDCDPAARGCSDSFHAGLLSWQHTAHLWFGLAMTVAILATTVAVAAALWPRPAGAAALGAGVVGAVESVLSFVAWGQGANGLVDRFGVVAMHVWLVAVAVGVLFATRPEPVAPEATPLRPRDFFGGDWSGTGTFTLRPLWLWRRWPQRFRLSRTATWISDEAWTFDDRAEFARGWTEQRTRFCRFESPAHVRVVSPDLPDGADVLFDENGYRVLPYRMTLPLGPVLLPVRCRDRARVDADGTLVETIDIALMGVPAVRVVMRVRSIPPARAEASHRPVALT